MTTTERLALRPGVPVLRRDSDSLQVGLHPPLAVRLPDGPAVRALLDALRSGRPTGPLHPTALAALDRLRAADLLCPTGRTPAPPRLTVAQAQFGSDAARRLAARDGLRVGIRAARAARTIVVDLLEVAGLRVSDRDPSVWLVVADGEVVRESLDPFVRAGTPHLVVAGSAAGRRIGPFVVPGHTACLRCVDAHEADADPRRPFLLEQAALTAVPAPVDPLLDRIALGWAVRDLCRSAEGDEPSTWSTTVDLGPSGTPDVVRRLRHPHCGCAWDLVLDTG